MIATELNSRLNSPAAKIREIEFQKNLLLKQTVNLDNEIDNQLTHIISGLPAQFLVNDINEVYRIINNYCKTKLGMARKSLVSGEIKNSIRMELLAENPIRANAIAKKYKVSPMTVQTIKEQLGLVKHHVNANNPASSNSNLSVA
jgi:hypothetical protein